jgi:hypothetical protein
MGQDTRATAITVLTRLGPNAAAMAMARIRVGKAKKMSVTLIRRLSQRPPSPTGQEAHSHPQEAGQEDDPKPHAKANPRAVDHPGQNVPAQLIRAQGVVRARGPEALR